MPEITPTDAVSEVSPDVAPATDATPQEVTVETLSGLAEDTVIETPKGEPNEKVVGDTDSEGNVIGWHKEAVEGTL